MAKFTDCEGREWSLRITVGDLDRVEAEAGVDLERALSDEKTLEALVGSPRKLVAVLYALCSRQADAAGVSPEAFGGGFDGAAVVAGVTALLGAVADFSHPPAVAEAVKERLGEAMREANEATAKAIRKPRPPASAPASGSTATRPRASAG